MQELDFGAVGPELVAVSALERRATRHCPVGVAGQPLPDPFEPGIAIVVVERLTRRHLGDVRRRVQGVRIHEGHRQPSRQRRPHRRLARSRYAHHHYGWPGPYRGRLRFHSTQPTPPRPSVVLTLTQARGNWLTRPSPATSSTGAWPLTSMSAVMPAGLRSKVAFSGNPF